MQFLNPIWLWGLSALSLPVAIHLLSRKEGKVIALGSIRFLEESPTAQFRHIKLNEKLLLLLRSLLIIFIVLLLAGFYLPQLENTKRSWLLIEPGLKLNSDWSKMADSLVAHGFEVRSFEEGFPLEIQSAGKARVSYWTLAEDLRTANIDSAVILSSGSQRFFKGKRNTLPTNVLWIDAGIDPEKSSRFMSFGGESLWKINASSDELVTRFEKSLVSLSSVPDSATVLPQDTIRIQILFENKYKTDVTTLIAALNALGKISAFALDVKVSGIGSKSDDKPVDWTFWLSDSTPIINKKLIRYTDCDQPALLRLVVHGFEAKHLCDSTEADYVLTKRLSVENALEGKLAQRLAEILLPHVFDTLDQSTMPDKMKWSRADNGRENITPVNVDTEASSNLLIILIVFTLLAERIIAAAKQQ